MLVPTIEIPEPFLSALKHDEAAKVCDLDASSPEALYARALARMIVARDNDARSDLEKALPHLGDVCRIELAFLDLRQRSAVEDALVSARFIEVRVEPNTLLSARTLHIIGLAEGKLRNTTIAVDVLFKSAEIYRALGNKVGLSQVYDTLGMCESARGQLDRAIHFYALSLVDKVTLGDRQGTALTLGNMGRLHLRAGRLHMAIDYFERDLEIAQEMKDERGQARMHEDLGRTYLDLNKLDKAEQELGRCLKISTRHNFKDMEFFAHKDLVLLRIAQGRIGDAEQALMACETALPDRGESYLHLLVSTARSDLLLAKGDPAAGHELSKAVEEVRVLDLPDIEIPARISLAKALVRQEHKALAEQCLSHALWLARQSGYSRYLPRLNETMAELDLFESIVEEYRQVTSDKAEFQSSYILRRELGPGAYGDVLLVYDPQHGEDVVLKRLRLQGVYDVKARNQILGSARVEMEAASRVRHPGVAQVKRIGYEPEGGMYVVREYVSGKPLRDVMRSEPSWDISEILHCVENIANTLQALHDGGVVHRDLKPENIIIRQTGMPVLVDLGVAYVAGHEKSNFLHVKGTIPYMAPEQAHCSKEIDGRADLYSLGVVFYEWLTGKLPIQPRGNSIEEVVNDIATSHPVPIAQYRSDIAPDLERSVMSLLAKKPGERPASAYHFVEQCRRFYSS